MSQTKSPGWPARFLLRPLFIFLSFMLVLFAIFQAGGRLTMASLHLLENQIAAVSTEFGVEITGLQGGWSGFNPQLQIDRVIFAGGQADEVAIELDVLESILENGWVLKTLSVADISLALVQDETGWQLKGRQAGQLNIELDDLLNFSDELSAGLSISLRNSNGIDSELTSQIRLANHSQLQYLNLSIATDLGSEEAPQEMVLEAWRLASHELFAKPANDFRVNLDGVLQIPRAVLPGDFRLSFKQNFWSLSEQGGWGDVVITAEYQLPEFLAPIVAQLDAKLSGNTTNIAGHITGFELSSGANHLNLSDGRIDIDLNDHAAVPLARYWQQELDLGELRSFVSKVFEPGHAAGRWTSSTAVQAIAHNIHVFFNREVGLGYSATLTDLSMRGYRGAPGVTQGQARLWGHGRGAALQVNADQSTLNFPDLFTDTWSTDYLRGVVKAWFRGGYLGLRGANIKTQIGRSTVAGDFSLTRPDEQHEQRVALTLHVDQADMESVKSFIPYKIPENLAEWLDYGLLGGALSSAAFAYQGQVHKRVEDGMHRRIELVTEVDNGSVQYERSWPIVDALDGRLHVAGQEIRVEIRSAMSSEVQLNDGYVRLADNAAFALVNMQLMADGQKLLDFVRNSPLSENMNFVTPAWESSGEMRLDALLTVPIRAEDAPELAVELQFDVNDFSLSMPEYRTELSALVGAGTFGLPHNLTGSFTGELFDNPVKVDASHDSTWIEFVLGGRIAPNHLYRVIGLDDLGVLAGEFEFESKIGLAMTDEGVTHLDLSSELVGMEVKLPGQLSKQKDAQVPLSLAVQFLADYQSISWHYKETQGWVHFDDVVQRGAIGLNANPPMTDHDRQAILIAGSLSEVILSDWVSGEGDAAVALPLDWSIQRLKIGDLKIDDLSFPQVELSGTQVGREVQFLMRSPDLEGKLIIPASGLVNIDLAYLKLPEAEHPVSESDALLAGAGFQEVIALPALVETGTDPLDVSVGYSLPAAEVSVERLDLGLKPFGNWSFTIEPQDYGVQLHKFSVDVNGIHIRDADVHWDLVANQTYFQGSIELDDLQETLPKWDYAAALQTTSAGLAVDARWAGSPANVDLLGMNGELRFRARDGRFLEVDSGGGLRVLSLLNFSNIAKRISFDFSDVTEEGMGFDKIDARIDLADGKLNFLDRMEVESKSSNFQIGGSVDLHTGILDNEMIVTLPVSDSLPWYGVYLAIANPLAGLGVLVGERVLRKPLRAFSTAKFTVGGTLDEPDVDFVGLWDRSMRENEAEPLENEAAVDSQP